MQVKNLLESCLRALYPYDARCFACGMEAPLNEACLCEACSIKIRRAGELTAPDGLCGLYAAFYYDEPLHRAVHSFKYLNARYLARYFAAAFSLPKHWEFDVIVPVPLHPKRLRRRGYNQSALLAVLLPQARAARPRPRHPRRRSRCGAAPAHFGRGTSPSRLWCPPGSALRHACFPAQP